MNRNDRLTLLACSLIFMIPVTMVAGQAFLVKPQPIFEFTADNAHYVAYVSVVWRHADGSVYAVSYDHNVLTNLGKNLIKTALGSTSANTTGVNLVNYIQIVNQTFTADAGNTYCCGTEHRAVEQYSLQPAQGTYASTGTGTWTITKVFTYDLTPSGTQTIYGAGLTISVTTGGAANNLFAEALFGTTAPLSANGDNVSVQWSLSVS